MRIAVVTRCSCEDGNRRWYIPDELRQWAEKDNVTLIPLLSDHDIDWTVKNCDGLIIPGCYTDIDPIHYSQSRHPATSCDLFDVYSHDRSFIQPFYRAGKPIVGICAGMQSLNVLFGGTLHQDIEGHRSGDHVIHITPGSKLHDIYGSTEITVNSLHHQSLDKVAEGFTVSAVSPDGCIEAFERDNILAVQWHPENMNDYAIFRRWFEK